ncbi:MAG: hypothetical protein ABGY30_01595 [Acidimicrobiales bacterium]
MTEAPGPLPQARGAFPHARTAGDQVMFGSDDPFPLGEEQPGRLVRGSAHLTSDQKEAVPGHNAVRFFDL